MRAKNGYGDDNPYEDVWDDAEEDPEADPTGERLGPYSPLPDTSHVASAHGKSSRQERSSMHWPGNQRREFDLP